MTVAIPVSTVAAAWHLGGVHSLLARRTGKWEHARQLGLLRCDAVVAWGLDVPLRETTLALQDRHDVGQVGGGFPLLRLRTGAPATLLPLATPAAAACPPVVRVASVPVAASSTVAILAAPGRTAAVAIPVPVPPVAGPAVTVLTLAVAVAPAGRVRVLLAAGVPARRAAAAVLG